MKHCSKRCARFCKNTPIIYQTIYLSLSHYPGIYEWNVKRMHRKTNLPLNNNSLARNYSRKSVNFNNMPTCYMYYIHWCCTVTLKVTSVGNSSYHDLKIRRCPLSGGRSFVLDIWGIFVDQLVVLYKDPATCNCYCGTRGLSH